MRAYPTLLISLALCLGFGTGPQSAVQAPPDAPPLDGLEVIEAQLNAFNAHDIPAMVANLSEEFVWYAVDRERVSVELQGRVAFQRSMQAYFAAFPDARAEIDERLGGGVFVAVRERAFWPDGEGGEQSQASLAVYEVRDGLIQAVWYYPVE